MAAGGWVSTSERPTDIRDRATEAGTGEPRDVVGGCANQPVESRYRLEGVLGEGATGRVYRAVDVDSARLVAVKRFVGRRGGAVVRSHQLAEVAALGAIDHPNVVRLLDRGEDADGPWLVTELVEGATLRQLLERSGPLELAQVAGVLDGALAGLAGVHARGLVHGDVKPENIVVEASSGTSKLIDVGVPGMGSPGYQAPELFAGVRPDVRTDLYAMGVVLFEALRGCPPRAGAHHPAPAWVGAHAPVSAPAGLSPEVAELLSRLLDEDPARRPVSAEALKGALDAAARHGSGVEWRARAVATGLSAVVGAGVTAIGLSGLAGPTAPMHQGRIVDLPRGTAANGRILRLVRVAHAVGMHKAAAVAVTVLISLSVPGVSGPRASDPRTPGTWATAGVANSTSTRDRRRSKGRQLTPGTGFAVPRAIEVDDHAVYVATGVGAL